LDINALMARAIAAAALGMALAGSVAACGPPDVTTTPTPSPTTQVASPSATADEPTASASPTAEQPPVADPAFADVNGQWCPTSPADWEEACIAVELPTAVYDDHPEFTEYVYPSSAETAGDPSTFVYDFAADADGCWRAAIDGYPAVSGAAFIYCPTGAEPGDWTDLNGDASVDRLFMGQDSHTYAYVRVDN
jgi:hypothetical protein